MAPEARRYHEWSDKPSNFWQHVWESPDWQDDAVGSVDEGSLRAK